MGLQGRLVRARLCQPSREEATTGTRPSHRAGRAIARRFVVLLLLGCAITFGVGACGTAGSTEPTMSAGSWTELHPGGEVPPNYSFSSMVHDPDSQKVVLCGSGASVVFTTTWVYDPGAVLWTDRGAPLDAPSTHVADPRL